MSLEDKCTQTAPNEQQRHQCDFCVKSYKNKSHLTYHVKTTHYRSSDKKPIYRFFQCRVCHQGRRNLLLLNVQWSNVFFVILVFETLSEQLLHEYLCHTLGKVPSTKNVAASVWRPWEPTFGAGSAGEGRGRKARRRRRRRQEAEVTVATAGHSPGPLKNAT